MSDPVIELAGISKVYGGLRPLRIAELRLGAGDAVALITFDLPMAETFANLVTGATLPDSGDVRLFGRLTREINDSADWLTTIDRLGIVSARAVLLDGMTPIQNLAMPFTLTIDPPPEDIRVRAEALAEEVGLARELWTKRVGELDAIGQLRVRLGRAIALDPALLLLEHASAMLQPSELAETGRQIRAIAATRGMAVLSAGADDRFAGAVARVLVHDPVTGRLKEPRRGWFSLGRAPAGEGG